MVHGRAQIHDVTIGGRRDGTIEAYHLDIVQDAGAYPSMGAFLPRLTRMMAAGTYAIPAVTSHARVVRHHHDAGGVVPRGRPARGHGRSRAGGRPVRGRGGPGPGRGPTAQPAARVREPHTDARGCDLRLRRLPRGARAGAGGRRATTTCGPSRRRRRAAGDSPGARHRAVALRRGHGGPRAGSEFGRVEVRRRPTTSVGDRPPVEVIVTTGSSPHGQGLATAFGHAGGRRDGPAGRGGAGGARRHRRRGPWHGHVRLAVAAARGVGGAASPRRAVVAAARERAAEQLEASVDDVVLDPATGRFHVVGTPAFGRSWADVVGPAGRAAGADGSGGTGAGRRGATSPPRSPPTRSAPTWRSSRSTPRPATSGWCASWPATTPAGCSTRCWPRASGTAGWRRARPRRCTSRSPSTPTATR